MIVNTTMGTMVTVVTVYLGRRPHTNTSNTNTNTRRPGMEGTFMMREGRVSTILLITEITRSMKTTFIACINIMTRSTS